MSTRRRGPITVIRQMSMASTEFLSIICLISVTCAAVVITGRRRDQGSS
jgi:hypothetical protein